MPTIEAVVFDLGGVVFESPLELIRDYEKRHGLPDYFIARVVGSYGATEGVWQKLERGEVPLSAFCERFDRDLEAFGHRVSSADLMREIAKYAVVRPEMVAAIRKIRESGRKVGALTNNWVIGDDHDEQLAPLRAEFDAFVESCKVGLRKPDPRIYGVVCEALGVSPPAVAFLDDMGPNLKAARALGMTTIKVESPGAALRELGSVIGLELS
jgi:putative hydrolase of the HAD superfamily